jgi:hypothetical protein
MTLKDLIDLAGERDLTKSYPKADGVYIWDYKLQFNQNLGLDLVLIPSDSGKAGFKDKVSVDELVNYVLDEYDPADPADEIISQMKIIGVEEITIARI